MPSGRIYSAKFADNDSKKMFLTWSAAQMFVYNCCAQESQYFDTFAQKAIYVPVPKPAVDQTYSHVIDWSLERNQWIKEKVPSKVYCIGSHQHYQAYQRYLKKLAKHPHPHRIKGPNRKLQLTREFFSIVHVKGNLYRVEVKSGKGDWSVLFRAHRPFSMPATVYIKTTANSVSVSFSGSCEGSESYPETELETAARLAMLEEGELRNRSVGIDRGIARPVQTSYGEEAYSGLSEVQKERMRRKEAGRKRHQKRLKRKQKGSNKSKKLRKKIAKTYVYAKNVRKDFAHQISRKLVDDPNTDLYVFEDLKIKNMTKKPAPKYNEAGKPLPNGKAAKSGLNKSILNAGWGQIKTFLTYKAREAGKLVIAVPPSHTSQKCAHCGHVDPDSRINQQVFRCVCCGKEVNADYNASLVIRDRGVAMLLEGKWKPKAKKKLLRLPKAKAKSEKTQDRGGSPRTGKAKKSSSRSCPQESQEAKKSLPKAALTAGSQAERLDQT